jgi:hypothetical protein
MEENNVGWDARLDESGIDAVRWSPKDDEGGHRMMTITFKETIDGSNNPASRLSFDVVLYPQIDAYSALTIPDELKERGIEEVWIVLVTDPFHHSVGYIKIKGIPEALKVIKRY